MPFFAIKFFLTPLSAPCDGHRRCCGPAYGGPASRANNTGCLYLMYRMMCNMCTRPPHSAPLSCCRAVGGCRRRGARLSAEARLQGGGRRFCGTISCGGSPGIRLAVAAWRCAGCAGGVPDCRQRPGCRAVDVASAGRFRAEVRPAFVWLWLPGDALAA